MENLLFFGNMHMYVSMMRAGRGKAMMLLIVTTSLSSFWNNRPKIMFDNKIRKWIKSVDDRRGLALASRSALVLIKIQSDIRQHSLLNVLDITGGMRLLWLKAEAACPHCIISCENKSEIRCAINERTGSGATANFELCNWVCIMNRAPAFCGS